MGEVSKGRAGGPGHLLYWNRREGGEALCREGGSSGLGVLGPSYLTASVSSMK